MATMNKVNSINICDGSLSSYNVGYKQIDNIINGLKLGSVIAIGARPAMGKTTFLNNVIINLLEKYNLPTLYVNLSNNNELVTLQLSSIISQKSYKEVLNSDEEKDKSMEKLKLKKYNLYISDDCYCISELEQLIEENKDIKFLAIDYIQLMKSDKFNTFTDQYNDVLDRVKILAKKYQLVVFLTSPISRNVDYREDKRPLMSDFRQNGNLENNSDVIILLYRDSYYYRDKNNGILEVIVSKNRYGQVGTTYLEYNEYESKFIDY